MIHEAHVADLGHHGLKRRDGGLVVEALDTGGVRLKLEERLVNSADRLDRVEA